MGWRMELARANCECWLARTRKVAGGLLALPWLSRSRRSEAARERHLDHHAPGTNHEYMKWNKQNPTVVDKTNMIA